MDNVRPTAFDTATIGGDDTTLTIVFWSGLEPCSVLDHVDVSYAADTVTVTLFQGSDPHAGDVPCIDIAVQKQVTITRTSRSPGATSSTGRPRRHGPLGPRPPRSSVPFGSLDPFMKILDTRVYRGPNLHALRKVIRLRVDLGELED